MTDSSKEPSQGAMRAAYEVLSKFGMVHASWQTTCAEIIDRESKAGEMADLLREMCKVPLTVEFHKLCDRAERLLTDLEVKP